MSRRRVLIVDDEPDILELVSYNLGKEHFSVSAATDGPEALSKLRKENFDLVVLDLMLPGMSGLDICRILRNDPKTASLPIIMLTARGEEIDRVLGLEMGADDYMTKPFSPRELIARTKAVLRRSANRPEEQRVLHLGRLEINKDTYTVKKGGRLIDLSSTEFNLLLFLTERKGRVFSRDQLLDAVWRDEAFVEPRTVDVHIRRLRIQIEDDPAQPAYVKTKRGIGYYVDAEA